MKRLVILIICVIIYTNGRAQVGLRTIKVSEEDLLTISENISNNLQAYYLYKEFIKDTLQVPTIDVFNYVKDKLHLFIGRKKLNISLQQQQDSIYENGVLFTFFIPRFCCSEIRVKDNIIIDTVYSNSDCGHFFELGGISGLISFSPKNGYIVYISGDFFTEDIKKYFFKDRFDKERIIQYVKYRYYSYQPSKIVFKTNEDISFWSNSQKKQIRISITFDHEKYTEKFLY